MNINYITTRFKLGKAVKTTIQVLYDRNSFGFYNNGKTQSVLNDSLDVLNGNNVIQRFSSFI